MHLLPSKTIHLFLYNCMFFLFQSSIRAQKDPILNFCDSPGNYTYGSPYDTNLKSILLSLPLEASLSNGYYNTSSGIDPDQVYGLAQCRGDVPYYFCQQCLSTTVMEIVRRCPNKKQAVIRFDYCLLRYSNQRFFSQLENITVNQFSNDQNASDQALFTQTLLTLMKNLSSTAADGSSWSKFATGSIGFANFSNIYGLVQCNGDLSNRQCYSCLQSMIIKIPSCCGGKTGGQVLSVSCYVRYEIYSFFQSPPRSRPPPPPRARVPLSLPPILLRPGPPVPLSLPPILLRPPPPPPPLPRREDSNSTNATNTKVNGGNQSRVIIYVSVATVLGLALFGCCIYYYLRERKRRHREEERHQALFHYLGPPVATELMESSMHGEQAQELPLIDLVTIQVATNNFSDENKLGQGGFGPVYKGILSDGKEIAVKRLSSSSGQGLQEFKNEVTLIAKLQHRNLVRLLYCCIEKGEKLLIYEYMPNTSLDVFIFDPRKCSQLGWERRQNIICGIAKGLVYLHEDSRLRIIHRDMKASNVLLDHEMNPKISDFGMAKFLSRNQSQINTSRVVGTYGYMAPECAMGGLFSVKSDVYSFGVLLLEIVSGKRNNSLHLPRHAISLLAYAWRLWCEGKALELIDPLLAESCPTSEVLRWIHIGLLCVQVDATDRPTMSSVIVMVGSESMTLPQPTQPGFFVAKPVTESDKSSASAKICSNNDVTMSTLEPR